MADDRERENRWMVMAAAAEAAFVWTFKCWFL